jgi:hypothetical protein
MRLLKELYTGKLNSFASPFRFLYPNGMMEERLTTVWVAKSECFEEADGRRWPKPLQIMFQCSTEYGVVVGDHGSHSRGEK